MPFGDVSTIQLDGLAAIRAVGKALQRIDPRLMDHGQRVGFIACRLAQAGGLELDLQRLFLLSLFHDIGAYKTDEIDRMVEFETSNVESHALYGYLFAKHMTPLGETAEAIRYHHTPWPQLESSGSAYGEYAALINLADRLDIYFLHRHGDVPARLLQAQQSRLFHPDYLQLCLHNLERLRLFEQLADGSYAAANELILQDLQVSSATALQYLQMLAFSIDFRSEHTVTHTVNTVAIAQDIARHFGFDGRQLENISLGALLHDVGKVAIPLDILECPGRLSPQQMERMRTHVNETESIISGLVPQEVCLLALRHHEKLDGSGYPRGLRGEQLSLGQRIVAVADIVSALSSRRSYKQPFPKQMTVSILSGMSGSQLDASVCDYVCGSYDQIMARTDNRRSKVIEKYQNMLAEFQNLRSER